MTRPAAPSSRISATTAPAMTSIGTGSGAAARSDAVIAASSSWARSVAIQPGTTQFTRTPSRPRSAVVKRISPAFAAAYSGER